VTAVQPGGTTSKQQLLREQLETLIQGMAPGDLLPAERRLAPELVVEGRSTPAGAKVVDAVLATARAGAELLGGRA
jgi:hypothetical protein